MMVATKSKKHSANWSVGLLALFVIGSLIGCSEKKTDSRLVGKWSTGEVKKGLRGEFATYDFHADGKFYIEDGKGKMAKIIESNWWVLKSHRDGGVIVRFQKEGQKPVDRLLEFYGDRIDLREKDGTFVVSWHAVLEDEDTDDSDTDDSDTDDSDTDDDADLKKDDENESDTDKDSDDEDEEKKEPADKDDGDSND